MIILKNGNYIQVQVVAIVMSCDQVTKETERTVGVCYKIQENLSLYTWEREEIFKFLTLINSRKPIYSAAGYFVISKSSLFGLLSVTTTYFIILIQFSQSL